MGTAERSNNGTARGNSRGRLLAPEMQVLAELGEVFSSDRDLDSLLEWIDTHARKLLRHDRFVVDLLTNDRESIRTFYVSGNEGIRRKQGEVEPVGGTLAGHVATTGTAFIAGNADKKVAKKYPSAANAINAGIKSWIAVPLVIDGESIGCAGFTSFTKDLFDEGHLQIATVLSNYVASAINTERLAGRLERESAASLSDQNRESTLRKIGLAISASLDIDATFQEFSQLVNELIPGEYLSIARIRENESVVRDPYIAGDIIRREPVDLDSSIAGLVAKEKKTFLANLKSDKEIRDFIKRTPAASFDIEHGFRSFLSVPLLASNKCVGVMHFRDREVGKFSDDQIKIAEQIATYTAPAVVNADLHLQIQHESVVQNALAEISRLLSSTIEVDQVVDDVRKVVETVVPADRLVISFLDELSGMETKSFISGLPIPGQSPQPSDDERSVGSVGASIDRSVTVLPTAHIDTATEESDFGSYLTRQAGLRSAMYAPLISGGRLLGTVNVKSTWPHAYSEIELNTFEQVARQLAGSIAAAEYSSALQSEIEVQAVLAELSRIISSTTSLDSVFDEVGRLLATVIPVDRLVISLVDAATGEMNDTHTFGVPITEWDGEGKKFPTGEGPLRAVEDREVVVTSTAQIDAMNPDQHGGFYYTKVAGLRSAIYAPLIVDSRAIGTLNAKSKNPDAYEEKEQAIFELISQQLSSSLAASIYSDALRTEVAIQEKLAQIARVMDTSNLMDEVWPVLGPILRELIPCERVSISFNDEDGQNLQVLHDGIDIPEPSSPVPLPIFPYLWESPLPPFVLEDSGVELSNEAESVEERARQVGLRSTLLAPVVSREEVVALLTFRAKGQSAFSDEEIRISGQIAEQINGAVTKSRAFRALAKAADSRDALSELGHILSMSLNLEELFDQLGEQVQKLIDVDRIALCYLTPDQSQLEVRYVYGTHIERQQAGWKIDLPEDAYGVIANLREHLLVNDESIAKYPWLEQARYRTVESGLPSLMFCPVVWQDEVIALLSFRSETEDAFTSTDVQTAMLIANRIAGSVSGFATYEKTKQQSEMRQALADISVMASQDLNLRSVGRRIVEGVRSLMSFDRISITSHDHETHARTLEYFEGVSAPDEYIGMKIMTNASDVATELSLPPSDEELERDAKLHKVGLRSKIFHPIGIRNSDPTGFLTIWSKDENGFTAEDQELLAQIATHITPAIQNAIVFEQAQQLANQREQSLQLDSENKELQRVADARSEFLSTVSHELRTPLTAISAFADILHRNGPENLSERQLSQIDVIRRSSNNLAELIDDLLDVSRADGGQLQVNFAPFDFTELLNEFILGSRSFLDDKRQNLSTSFPDHSIWIDADSSRLSQVMNNLLANASKYSAAGSTITLKAELTDNELRVEFSDHGIGISNDDIKRIFVPFFRSSNTATQQEPGTGLGLSVVKSLVELHDGRIEVESELEKGTRITFYVPKVIEAPAETA